MGTAQKADTDGYLYLYRHYKKKRFGFGNKCILKVKERFNIWQYQPTKSIKSYLLSLDLEANSIPHAIKP